MLKLLNPHNFSKISNRVIKPLAILFTITLCYGIYLSLFASPPDYQQGEMVRLMYIHVPSAWMSLGIYMFIAGCSLSSIVWKTRLSFLLAVSAAPIGACFAFTTLVTGSIWGKTMWGTWWVWDARLTSMLILFLLYLSYIIVVSAADHLYRAEKPASVIALVGAINVPIVKFSVDMWNSLHQPASILRAGGPSIHSSMLLPLMVMFFAAILLFLLVLLVKTNNLIKKIKIS